MGESKFRPGTAKNLKRKVDQVDEIPTGSLGHVIAQFKSVDTNEATGPPLNLPVDATPEQLQMLINELLNQSDDPLPYAFYVDSAEITNTLHCDVIQTKLRTTEDTITIIFHPQAIFRVRAVTRCTSTLSGHTEAILTTQFSPDGSQLATGSGDTTVRIWDLNTETPQFTLEGHKHHVLVVAWSPDGKTLASADVLGSVRLWDPLTGKPIGDTLRGHLNNAKCNRLASSSKDGTVRVWDTILRKVLYTISQHTAAVTCVKWGGEGLLYTGSQDKTIKVWDAKDGKLVKTLEGHGHWVNSLALSTDFVLRTGPFDHTGRKPKDESEGQAMALARYQTAKGDKPERLVSGSDDFTMFFWEPEISKKPLSRLTGHQKLVNHVTFSPDGRIIASASFDNSVKLWDGLTGKFITSLRGHVAHVYQACFSSDSRMLLSCSKDSTIKCWDLKTKKLKLDLPGHLDEVFTIDWSPGGDKVASGGKDRQLKIWRQ